MNDLENLNIDDLDVEELERRVELASAAGLNAEEEFPELCGLIYWQHGQA